MEECREGGWRSVEREGGGDGCREGEVMGYRKGGVDCT